MHTHTHSQHNLEQTELLVNLYILQQLYYGIALGWGTELVILPVKKVFQSSVLSAAAASHSYVYILYRGTSAEQYTIYSSTSYLEKLPDREIVTSCSKFVRPWVRNVFSRPAYSVVQINCLGPALTVG